VRLGSAGWLTALTPLGTHKLFRFGAYHAWVPAFTLASVFTEWVRSPLGIMLPVGLSIGYAVCLVAAWRRSSRPSVFRALIFYVMGVGSLVLATDGGLAAYREVSFVAAAAQSGVLAAITPMGLALGDPLGLASRASGQDGPGWLHRVSTARVSRILMFPALASLLAVGVHLGLFVTPWLAASVASGWVRELTYLALLATGLLFVLPLLSHEELLPSWCTAPLRAVIAFADGLLDALPGVIVMAWPGLLGAPVPAYLADRDPLWQQRLGGAAMFAIAEVVGLPLLAAVIVDWIRSDDRTAKEIDAALDLAHAQRVECQLGEEAMDRPWWENDPRFTGRFR